MSVSLPGEFNPEQHRLLVEPVEREDGTIVYLYESRNKPDWVFVYAAIVTGYSREEIDEIGHGNINIGIMAVGKAYVNATDKQLSPDRDHLSYEEIHGIN